MDRIFALRLLLAKFLNQQKLLVLSFIDNDEAFDSVDKRPLTKVLSLYGKSDNYIKVINVNIGE